MPTAGCPASENRQSQFLVQQAAENHNGGVARFAIGDAQAVGKFADNSHARKRGGKNSPATMNYQQLVAGSRQLGDLAREHLHIFLAFEQCACDLDDHSHRRPAVSG